MILALTLAAAFSVPADVYENMLLLDGRMNGGLPRTFLLDTPCRAPCSTRASS
jgi:hypothetical protein